MAAFNRLTNIFARIERTLVREVPVPDEPKTVKHSAKDDPKTKFKVLSGSREPIIGPPVPPNTSIWSRMTVMIPRPRPDQDISQERRELKERIKKNGLKQTVDEIVEEYYLWKADPNPISAWRKKRATLIFSKAELAALIPVEIHRLVGDFEFLTAKKP